MVNSEYTSKQVKELVKLHFDEIHNPDGSIEYRKNEISFFFCKNDIIIAWNDSPHVYNVISKQTFDAILYFCNLDDNIRISYSKTFNGKNFITKIRNLYTGGKPYERKY